MTNDTLATLTLPPQAYIVSGDNPAHIGEMENIDTKTVNWTLIFTALGTHSVTVEVDGYYTGGQRAYSSKTRFVTVLAGELSPPAITILSPENTTYYTNNVPLTFTVNETTTWIGYSLNGQDNVTILGNTTLAGLVNGTYSVTVYASDSNNNMGKSDTVHFTFLDITPPTIIILSPENRTYGIINIPLTVHINEPVTWIGYSLDSQANVTIEGNATLSILEEGLHTVMVFATDTVDQTGASDLVFFSFTTVYDVAITLTTTSKTACLPIPVVGKGYTANVYVTIENQGTFTETFNVSAYADTSIIGSQQATLNSWENQTLVFVWNTADLAYGNYTISATADTLPGETDTVDNTMNSGVVLVTIPGDADGDREVTIYDIVRIADVYNVIWPNPKYDANCDWNDDGGIDIYDIVIAADNYEKSW